MEENALIRTFEMLISRLDALETKLEETRDCILFNQIQHNTKNKSTHHGLQVIDRRKKMYGYTLLEYDLGERGFARALCPRNANSPQGVVSSAQLLRKHLADTYGPEMESLVHQAACLDCKEGDEEAADKACAIACEELKTKMTLAPWEDPVSKVLKTVLKSMFPKCDSVFMTTEYGDSVMLRFNIATPKRFKYVFDFVMPTLRDIFADASDTVILFDAEDDELTTLTWELAAKENDEGQKHFMQQLKKRQKDRVADTLKRLVAQDSEYMHYEPNKLAEMLRYLKATTQ